MSVVDTIEAMAKKNHEKIKERINEKQAQMAQYKEPIAVIPRPFDEARETYLGLVERKKSHTAALASLRDVRSFGKPWQKRVIFAAAIATALLLIWLVATRVMSFKEIANNVLPKEMIFFQSPTFSVIIWEAVLATIIKFGIDIVLQHNVKTSHKGILVAMMVASMGALLYFLVYV